MNTKIIALLAVVAIVLAFVLLGGSKNADAPVSVEDESNAQTESTEESADTESNETTEEDTGSAPTPQATAPAPSTPSSQPATTPTTAPAPVTNYPTSAVVTYSGSHFVPSEVTIIEGGSVTFINQSDEVKMWIGSDNHPSHKRYPLNSDDNCLGSDFDQCTAVGEGQRWSFVFDRFGEWGYHNHVRAKDNGTVHVYTKEQYDKLIQ